MDFTKNGTQTFVLLFKTLVLCLVLGGCDNPLGDQDQRDSSFTPGGGGSGGGGVVIDTTPPGPALSLSLLSRWTTGPNPAESPLFSWNNPSEDFESAEVALGVSLGGQEIIPFVESTATNSHTFESINLSQCSPTYYPSVRVLDAAGNLSPSASETLGFRYDNTNPLPVGAVTIPAWDAGNDRTVTVDWSSLPGSDNCGIDHYEIALSFDSGNDGFDTGDIGNIIGWSAVPGGNVTTSYQILDGVDGFSFTSTFNRQYYISIRVVDGANLASSPTHSMGWYTFYPTQIVGLEMWFDSSNPASLFQDNGCSTTPAVSPGAPVACWLDQSGMGNHSLQTTGGFQPLIGATGLFFDGIDDILTVATKTYTTSSDLSIILHYESDTQSTASGSCCRPIVSFATNSTGVYAWLGLTRGDFTPPNNLFHGWLGAGLGYVPTTPGDPFIISATHNGTAALWNAWSSGSQQVVNQAISSFTSTVFSVGGDIDNPARRVRGEIYEVIVIEDLINSSDREKLEGYLACKYSTRDSLDPTHPFYDFVGANLTGCP